MKMILFLQCWINHWSMFSTHEFIISWNSLALTYLCKDFTEYSLPMNSCGMKFVVKEYESNHVKHMQYVNEDKLHIPVRPNHSNS